MYKWWWNEIPEESVQRAIQSFQDLQFTSGPRVREVEKELADTLRLPDVVLVNSGTSALTAGLISLGVGPGRNVIVPALTWIATAQAAQNLGAEVRVVDVEPKGYGMDPDSLEKAIDEKTAAVIFVLFNGRPGELSRVKDICNSASIPIIEDRCKGMGTTLLSSVEFGATVYAALSLGMISHVSIGYGGALACGSIEDGEKIRKIRDHGMVRETESYSSRGTNLKISDYVAALASPQLRTLRSRVNLHSQAEKTYAEKLSDSQLVRVQTVSTFLGAAGTYVELLAANRRMSDELTLLLAKHGVEVRAYHPSISRAKYLGDYSCPIAEGFDGRLLALPSGNKITPTEASLVSEIVRKCLSSLGDNK